MFSGALIAIVSQRIWQGLSGILTLAFIAHFLTPDQQGWFYTFVSLASVNFIFEMGLSVALVQITAHMFNTIYWLPQGRIGGQDTRSFISFFSAAFRVYLLLSFFFVIVTFWIGYFIFQAKSSYLISDWLVPWLFLLSSTAANMFFTPFFAVLEGSGDLVEVYRVRFLQGVLGALTTWVALSFNGVLWAASMAPISSFVIALVWFGTTRYNLLRLALSKRKYQSSFNWKLELWPLQWRLGLNWVSIFFTSQIGTPFLFYYQNSTVAGQFALTSTIANMLGILSQSWITRRIPIMSKAVAKKEWVALDSLFKKDLKYSMVVFVFGSFFILVTNKILSYTLYADRLLDFWAMCGILIFTFFNYINISFAIQIRSFKKEPFVFVSLIGGLLIFLSTVISSKYYSVYQLVLSMLFVQIFIITPFSLKIWKASNIKLRLEC